MTPTLSDDAVQDCKIRGTKVLSVTTTPTAWNGTSALAGDNKKIKTALGLHPQLAHERKSELSLFDKLLPQTLFVGEIGLDGAPEFSPHWNDQMAVFDHILSACSQAGGRILSIHSRRSSRVVLDRLEAHPRVGVPVLHWFTGSIRELERAICLGYWFSVGPSMLRSDRGKALVAHMPHDRVLPESDGPFAQIDGMALMPWEADQVVPILADLWFLSKGEISQIMLQNFQNILSFSPNT